MKTSTDTQRTPHNPLLRVAEVVAQPFINQVLHADFLNNELPDKCAQLIIADPPYFEVKGEFDFVWKSFADYLKDVEKWAIECKRLLADNGTLFWYGHAKKLAYTQVIIDKYFNLENNIAIEFNRQTKKGVEEFRCFAPVSERLLMYSNDVEIISNPFAVWIKYNIDKIGIKMNDIDVALKYVRKKNPKRGTELCRRWCEGSSIPKFSDFNQLQTFFNDFTHKYDELLNTYETNRRPFNNYLKLFDIMSFDQEAHITGKYDHDTCKPETLTRALILTCSRENDLVVVPFSGSGTECAMSIKEKRRAIGFDVKREYVEMSNARIKKIVSAPTLF